MKYTLNDIPGASYTFDPTNRTIDMNWISFQLNLTNVRSIINATTSQVIQEVDESVLAVDSIDVWNIIHLSSSLDMSWMAPTDELIFIFDIAPQAIEVKESSLDYLADKMQSILLVFNRFLSYFQALTNKDASWRLNVNVNTGTVSISWTPTVSATISSWTLTTLSNITSIWGQDAKTMQMNLSYIAYAVNRRKVVNYT